MGKIIGIDLGTTKSVVAVYDANGAEIISNKNDEDTTPSYVAIKDGREILIGGPAKRQAATNTKDTLFGVKRLIGRKINDPDVVKMAELAPYAIVEGVDKDKKPNGDAWVMFNGEPMSPATVASFILKELKEAAEEKLGETVSEAVITVPAYFNQQQREATKQAGEIAGLKVLRIIPEPTAAAMAYGLDSKRDIGKIAVFDLGGGTFDVSILEINRENVDGVETSVIEVIATNGDTFLGGENFDERIVEHFAKALKKEHGIAIDMKSKAGRSREDETILARLREAAEKAKIELSNATTASVNLPYLAMKDGIPVNFETTLTRAEMNGILKDLVEKTRGPCLQSLKDAGLTIKDIDTVLLVGSQTHMPLVKETVENIFQQKPRSDVSPSRIVALGAAAQGGVLQGTLKGVLLLDVIPLSIGIKVAGGAMSTLIERNTSIPHKFEGTFSTARDNQPNIEVVIFQGERPVAEDNKLLGRFTLDGIPPQPKQVPQIELTLSIDANGLMTASAKDLKTGRQQHITIKADGGLSPEQIEQIKKEAEKYAEADAQFRVFQKADAEARVAVNDAENDVDQDYFKEAPEELKVQFHKAIEDIAEARKTKNADLINEKVQILSETRSAIGLAFGNAASPAPAANDDVPPAKNPPKKAAGGDKAPKL